MNDDERFEAWWGAMCTPEELTIIREEEETEGETRVHAHIAYRAALQSERARVREIAARIEGHVCLLLSVPLIDDELRDRSIRDESASILTLAKELRGE